MVKTQILDEASVLLQTDAWPAFEVASLPQEAAILIAQHDDGAIKGLATLQPLPWDSSIYGLQMGKIAWLLASDDGPSAHDVKERLLADLLDHGAQQGYQHLMARVSAQDYSGLHALEVMGFRCMDVRVTLACSLASVPAVSPTRPNISPYSPADLPALQQLSARAHQRSRLFADPSLPAAATERLHELWIENDCRGRAAMVLVAHLDDEPVGYIACLLHAAQPQYSIPSSGDIDLLAVSPAARRRGIGLSLVQAALNWFRQRTDRVTVKTQVTNYPVLALYQRAGFVLEQAQVTLHQRL